MRIIDKSRCAKILARLIVIGFALFGSLITPFALLPAEASLRAGDTIAPENIADLQLALAQYGYDPGPADGILGGRTRNAIRLFQADAGLQVDGYATEELLAFLRYKWPSQNADSPVSPAPVMPPAEPLTSGDPVIDTFTRSIQEELKIRGYYNGTVDGVVGPRTMAAVRLYQQHQGLAVDGQPSLDLLNHLRIINPR